MANPGVENQQRYEAPQGLILTATDRLFIQWLYQADEPAQQPNDLAGKTFLPATRQPLNFGESTQSL